MSPLLVVLPYCSKDVDLAEKLLNWIVELGENKKFSMILCRDSKVPKERGDHLKTLAMSSFRSAASLPMTVDVPYPAAANVVFSHVSNWIQQNYRTPFLWLEPDAVPLTPDWMDQLATEYYWQPKKFMGPFIHSNDPKFPKTHLNGVSIYPNNAWDILNSVPAFKGTTAWDIASAAKVVPMASDTKLISQFFGTTETPPTFREKRVKGDPEGIVTTKIIHERAVLYHRSKDGSLIDLARKRMNEGVPVIEAGNVGYQHAPAA